MKTVKRILSNIDKNKFKRYLFFSVLIIITLILISSYSITQSRYETSSQINLSPTLAFFVVDVQSQTGQIKLESMIPRTEPYLYTFNVSNFQNNKRANVDLTYSIEIITTTNMPLEFQIFKGNDMTQNTVDSDTITTDTNGVYLRHLVINNVSTMIYTSNVTDTYVLWVSFPEMYKNNSDAYAGIIDLVDIKINAEQVV